MNRKRTFSQSNETNYDRSFRGGSDGSQQQTPSGTTRELINKYRIWRYENSSHSNRQAQKAQKEPFRFSLVSYNILSQELLEQHSDLYVNCKRKDLAWHRRRRNIFMELEASKADIFCLQEVEEDHFHNDLLPHFARNHYKAVFKRKTGDKQTDGCALFYKSGVFSLQLVEPIEYNRKDLSPVLDRDNIGLIAVLRPLYRNRHDTKLVVATTHLLFNPKRGDVKFAQLRLLLAEIDKVAFKYYDEKSQKAVYHPVILCGDMNSEPNSSIFRFIREGIINLDGVKQGDLSGQSEGLDRGHFFRHKDLEICGMSNESKFNALDGSLSALEIRHNFAFKSVYPATDREGKEFVSTHHSKVTCKVDYIFYNRIENLKLIGYKRLLTSDEMEEIGPIPNEYLGSDHLSLQAKFNLLV